MRKLTAFTIAFVGQVDHGKSSLLGRLLHDSGHFAKDKIDQVRGYCKARGQDFEFAFLLDALADERSKAMTLDYARAFLTVGDRAYRFVDAPGHREFVGGMLTGASRAEAAVILCDIGDIHAPGLRRHVALVELLGIKDIAVFINKMDTVSYSQESFLEAKAFMEQLLSSHRLRARAVIPGSAREGDNVVTQSSQMSWYKGETLMAFMATVEAPKEKLEPFRFFVQDSYGEGIQKVSVGQVLSGEANVGDLVSFLPSGFTARIASVETFPKRHQMKVSAGQSVALVFEPSVAVERGELVVRSNEEAPTVQKRFRVTLFWFAETALTPGKTLTLRSGTSECAVKVVRVLSSVVSGAQTVQEDRVVSCELLCEAGVLVESSAGVADNNRFVVVDGFETVGIGRKAFANKEEKSANVPQKRVR